jgi:phospholipase/carboxylesterase
MTTPRFSSEARPANDNVPELACDLEPAPAPTVAVHAQPATQRPARTVYVPEYYEPNYAYPLIVWVQEQGGNVFELQRVLPLISSRNYVGMSLGLTLPGTCPAGSEQTEAPYLRVEALEKQVQEQVRELRRQYHIHSERIFLAGFGEGASLALQLGLARPEWFAGMICLGGHFPITPHSLRRFRDLRGKRVLLGAGSRDRKVSVSETVEASRLLHAAGMRVCTRIYDAGHQLTRPMLLDIDRWVMQEILQPQPV